MYRTAVQPGHLDGRIIPVLRVGSIEENIEEGNYVVKQALISDIEGGSSVFTMSEAEHVRNSSFQQQDGKIGILSESISHHTSACAS